jgi:hypothetical protein
VTPTAVRRGTGRGWLLLALVVVAVVGLVLASGPGSGEPYDLDDAGVTGYKGLRLLLEDLGATVRQVDASDVGPRADVDVAFVPVAVGADRAQVARWRSFARAGGTLVLGTPLDRNASSPSAFGAGLDIVALPPRTCDVPRLADARAIDPAGADAIHVPAGAESCYGDGTTAMVVRQPLGAGEVVTLASPDLLTNEAMRPHDQEVDDPARPMADNVVVAARLLDPGGTATVAVVTSGVRAAPVGGDTSLADLVSPGVKLGLWQLVVAFVLFAWYRGRRLGRVVAEPQPVPVAASELVAAVGNLMERRDDPGRAAALLRAETTAELTARLGVPRSTDPSIVAALVAERTGRDADAVAATLSHRPVTTDEQLLAVAAQLDVIRQEVLHGRHPAR